MAESRENQEATDLEESNNRLSSLILGRLLVACEQSAEESSKEIRDLQALQLLLNEMNRLQSPQENLGNEGMIATLEAAFARLEASQQMKRPTQSYHTEMVNAENDAGPVDENNDLQIPTMCIVLLPEMGSQKWVNDDMTTCEYQEIKCSNSGCNEILPKDKLQHHIIETCKYKPSRCQHCAQHIPEVDMEAHLHMCTKFPMACDHCGTSNIPRDEMEQHLTRECPEADKPCKFQCAGCLFKAKDEVMNEHDQSHKTEHLNLMLEFTRTKEKTENDLKEKLVAIEHDNTSLQSQLSTHRETLAAATQDLRSYQTGLGKVEHTVGEHRREIAQLREGLPDAKSVESGKNSEFSFQFEEMRRTLTEQEVKLSGLEAELARGGLTSSMALHDIQPAEHDCKMLQATSYDGTYIWKIDEFTRRQHDAVIGKTPSLYSPPFYVGRYGYKVCARVYPNGDGMGKGTHLSLFFVIMKGDYDAIIPWPFRQKVTFKLLDHDRQNDITDTSRPDPNSSSFKRPTSNMNMASGCPVFVSQQNLQKRSYVTGDTMFIKIIVDTTGLPSLAVQ